MALILNDTKNKKKKEEEIQKSFAADTAAREKNVSRAGVNDSALKKSSDNALVLPTARSYAQPIVSKKNVSVPAGQSEKEIQKSFSEYTKQVSQENAVKPYTMPVHTYDENRNRVDLEPVKTKAGYLAEINQAKYNAEQANRRLDEAKKNGANVTWNQALGRKINSAAQGVNNLIGGIADAAENAFNPAPSGSIRQDISNQLRNTELGRQNALIAARTAQRNAYEDALKATAANNLSANAMSAGNFASASRYNPNLGNDKEYDPVYETINRSRRYQTQILGLDSATVNGVNGFIANREDLTPEQKAFQINPYNYEYNSIDENLYHLTDEERAVYNWYYNTGDRQAAAQYLESIYPELEKRRYAANDEEIRKQSTKNAVNAIGASIMSPVVGAVSGIAAIPGTIETLRTGRVNPYASYNSATQFARTARQAVADKIAESGTIGAKAASWIYQVGEDIFENGLRTAALGGLGVDLGAGMNLSVDQIKKVAKATSLSPMLLSVFQSTANEAKLNGRTDEEAIALASIAAGAEWFTESKSFEHLFDTYLHTLEGKGSAANWLGQVSTEALEEGGSNIINTIADILLLGDESEWSRSIRKYQQEEHLSESEAKRKAFIDKAVDLVSDVAGGAISGGVLGGGALLEASVEGAEKRQNRTSENTKSDVKQAAAKAQAAADAASERARAGMSMTADQWEQSLDQSDAAKKRRAEIRATGEKYNVSEEAIRTVEAASDSTGRVFHFYSQDPVKTKSGRTVRVNGRFDENSGEIWINSQSKKPVTFIIGHELTHSTELTKHYKALRSAAMEYLKSNGVDVDAHIADVRETYNQSGIKSAQNLSDDEIKAEMVADYVGSVLLTDEGEIDRLVNARHDAAQAIWNWINVRLTKLAGGGELYDRAMMTRAREIYGRALKAARPAENTVPAQAPAEAAAPAGEAANGLQPPTAETPAEAAAPAETAAQAEPAAPAAQARITPDQGVPTAAGGEEESYETELARIKADYRAGLMSDEAFTAALDALNEEYGRDMSTEYHGDMRDIGLENEKGEATYSISSDLDKMYPGWNDNSTTSSGRDNTQIAGTISTYRRIGEYLERTDPDARILDASSGLGLGTQDLRNRGFDIDDVEPFPSDDRRNNTNGAVAPTYYDYADIPEGSYDVVISNAVLNVIPDDWRNDVVDKMARAVAPGGKLIVNVRDAAEVAKTPSRIPLENASEILVTQNGKPRHYQKGFTQIELENYMRDRLGDGWTVEKATPNNSGLSSGSRAVVAVKDGGKEKYSITEEEDREYIQAAEAGDTETAQRMVDEAAKKAGYTIKAYHGTANGGAFTIFDPKKLNNTKLSSHIGQGFYFTNDRKAALEYTKNSDIYGKITPGSNPHLFEGYIKLQNPIELTTSSHNLTYNQIRNIVADGNYDWFFSSGIAHELQNHTINGEKYTKDQIRAMDKEQKINLYARYLTAYGDQAALSNLVDAYTYNQQDKLLDSIKKHTGYDGVHWNMREGLDQFVVFDSSQFKDGGAITRDDDGNIIPLSERFNPQEDDIRWSITDEDEKDLKREVANDKPLPPRREIKASISLDPDYQANAVKKNEQTKMVASSVLNHAGEDRETVAAKLESVREEANLPPDVTGNTAMGNSAYGTSEENTSVCPRSLGIDALTDLVAEKLGRPLTVEESIYIAQDAFNFTDMPECLYCYVMMDRLAKREYLGEYIRKRDAVIENLRNGMSEEEALAAYKAEETKGGKAWTEKGKGSRFRSWVKAYKSGAPLLQMSDLASESSVENAMKDKKLAAQANDAMSYAQSASWAKKRVGFSAYNNHILKWSQDRIDMLNSMFGLRMYSFSDYSPAYVLENMQMVTDAAVRGLKMLAYTKELDFVRIFAGTGMNINISTFGFTDERTGNIEQDGMQGADWIQAQALRAQYPNVGITFVATSDEQVEWALDQDWIDVVIPFHMVKTGARVAQIFGYKNFTGESSDRKLAGATKKEIYPNEHQNNREKYFEALEEAHLAPRFERWKDHPNYMKLVNETRRSAQDTPAVQPVFNVDAAIESINGMVKRGGYNVPIGRNLENMADIAEEMADRIAEGAAENLQIRNGKVISKGRQQNDGNTKLSITPEEDDEYIQAAEAGDTETAQRMVDEAAKAAGYTVKVYHGTTSPMQSASRGMRISQEEYNKLATNYADKLFPFVIFRPNSFHSGIYTATDRGVAEDFTFSFSHGGTVFDLYAKAENPMRIDAGGRGWNNLPADVVSEKGLTESVLHSLDSYNKTRNKSHIYIDDVVEFAKREGYDSVIVDNVRETGTGDETSPITTDVIVFSSDQIKSADPITYDDYGNIIPLSERFNPENEDIRWSMSLDVPGGEDESRRMSDELKRELLPDTGLTVPTAAEPEPKAPRTKGQAKAKRQSADEYAKATRRGADEYAERVKAGADEDASLEILRAQEQADLYRRGAEAEVSQRLDQERDQKLAAADNLTRARRDARAAAHVRKTNADITVPATDDTPGQKKMFDDQYRTRNDYKRIEARAGLSDKDADMVADLMAGRLSPEYDLGDADDPGNVLKVFNALVDYDRASRTVEAYRRQKNGELRETADRLLEHSERFKDKKTGIAYERETQMRNIRDIAPAEDAEAINREYFYPIAHHSRQANDLMRECNQRVEDLGISRKIVKGIPHEYVSVKEKDGEFVPGGKKKLRHNRVSEAYAVQFVGEMQSIMDQLAEATSRWEKYGANPKFEPKRNGISYAAAAQALDEFRAEYPSFDYEGELQRKIDGMKQIYSELLEKMNAEYMRWGYEPMGEIKGYFPHFISDGDNLLQRIGKRLGIDQSSFRLPTEIVGETADRKPGVRWFGNKLERKTNITDYDALEGFAKYIRGAADVIYHTEDIQKIRQFINQIRYNASDKGIREKARAIMNDPTKDDDEKNVDLEKLYENLRFGLSNYVVNLTEYANLLANKRSMHDRGWEGSFGRNKLYRSFNSYNRIRAMAAVAGNMTSALTNLIPVAQVTGIAGVGNTEKAFFATIANMFRRNGGDNLRLKSDFLMNRDSVDPVNMGTGEKAIQAIGWLFEKIDRLGSETVWRACYYDNRKKGMSESAAAAAADRQAAGVVADRSKGGMPTLFSSKNPLISIGTRFMLEANNTISYYLKDIPKERRDKGRSVLLGEAVALFFTWLYNEGFQYLFGRRPAQEPSELVNDIVGDLSGYRMPNTIKLGTQLLSENRLPTAEDFKVKQGDVVKDSIENAIDLLPFTGWADLINQALGLGLEIQGGRFPVGDVMPDFNRLSKMIASNFGEEPWEKQGQVWAEELTKPLSGLLPGGNQAQKTAKGIATMIAGGSYIMNSKGQKQLQYPAQNTPGNWARAVIAGKSSLPTATEWVENGFDTLSAEDTEIYDMLTGYGTDPVKAVDLIKEIRKTVKTDEETEAHLQRQTLIDSDIDPAAKLLYYDAKFATDKEKTVIENMGPEDGTEVIKALDGLKASDKGIDDLRVLLKAKLSNSTKELMYNTLVSQNNKENISALKAEGLDFGDYMDLKIQHDIIDKEDLKPAQKANEWSYWLDKQDYTEPQKAAIKDNLAFWGNYKAEPSAYEKVAGSGVDTEKAYDIYSQISELEPLPGEKAVSNKQKWNIIVNSDLTDSEQLDVIKAVSYDGEYYDYKISSDYGVNPKTYYDIYVNVFPKYDADGNGSYKQAEIKAALDSVKSLTNQQRAAIWQLHGSSSSAKNNPYSQSVGSYVLGMIKDMKAETVAAKAAADAEKVTTPADGIPTGSGSSSAAASPAPSGGGASGLFSSPLAVPRG